MTDPLFDPSPQSPRRNWLLRYIGVQEKYDAIIATALLDAADSAAEGIRKRVGDDAVGASVRRYQLQLAKREIHSVIKLLFVGLADTIRAGQSEAAVAALEAGFQSDARILNRLFPNRLDRERYQDELRQSANRGVQAMMTRVLDSQIPLSRRVYHTRALANGTVDRIVNSSLATGDSAAELAQKVRSSIRPDVPGGVGYAAKRLARTEINNAYHAQSISDVQDKPWVESVDWNLSKVHAPQNCRCEIYARIRTFPKEAIPRKPHPQCMCYIVPQLMPQDEFESNLIAGFFTDYGKRNA